MNEQELRRLVRDAIASHGGASAGVAASHQSGAFLYRHVSHGMFTLPVGADTDGPCLIEPAVTCNHCGYCKSYGH